MTFIRTSEWETHKVELREKGPDGELRVLGRPGADGMSRDLSIKGVHVKKGGASLHKVDEGFVLKPNECVVLETREHITTGPQVLGFICSRASLASKGLIVSNLKVDPNYSDTLYITVFNAGTGSIPLEPGYPFCAVVFCQTDGECQGETRRPDPEGISDGWAEKLMKARPYIVTGAVYFRDQCSWQYCGNAGDEVNRGQGRSGWRTCDMVERRLCSRNDPRYTALRRGLEQLDRHQLTVLEKHVESGSPIVVDGCNYDPASRTWCPLAVALEVERVLRDEGMAIGTDEEAKECIVSIGTRTNPKFGLNPMHGVVGKFFTGSRRGDLLQACQDVLAEKTYYRG